MGVNYTRGTCCQNFLGGEGGFISRDKGGVFSYLQGGSFRRHYTVTRTGKATTLRLPKVGKGGAHTRCFQGVNTKVGPRGGGHRACKVRVRPRGQRRGVVRGRGLRGRKHTPRGTSVGQYSFFRRLGGGVYFQRGPNHNSGHTRRGACRGTRGHSGGNIFRTLRGGIVTIFVRRRFPGRLGFSFGVRCVSSCLGYPTSGRTKRLTFLGGCTATLVRFTVTTTKTTSVVAWFAPPLVES